MRWLAGWRVLVLASTLLAASFPGFAQEAPGPALRGEGPGEEAVAPVEVDGRTLFSVAGIPSFPAPRRAAIVSQRIRELADDAAFDPATLQVTTGELDSKIGAGERIVIRVLDADGEIEGLDRRVLAEVFLRSIQQSIQEYRAARTSEALGSATTRAGIATLAVAIVVVLVLLLAGALKRWLERRYRERVHAVTISSFEVVRAERLWGFVRGAARLATALALLAVTYFYLHYTLGLFPWTRGAAGRLDDWVLAPLAVLGMGLVARIPDLLFLAVLYLVVRWALRLVHVFFAAVGRGEVALSGFDADWAEPTYKLVRVAIVAFGLIVAYPYIPGSSSEAFKGVSLFLGIVFSLGSSSAISNIIAGYTMTYRRAFREGDRVKIAGILGDVSRVRLQVTHLRTPKNEEVVVPNSTILGSEVVNYSTLARERGLILHTTVGIGYETPWRQVEAMLHEAARRTEGLLAEPKPFVLQTVLGDFAVTYEINVYCDTPQLMGPLYTALHRNILDVFNEYGVQIMTPAYEGDPEQPKIVPKEQWYPKPAAGP
jgi:small-conductance mechanosensitive channel